VYAQNLVERLPGAAPDLNFRLFLCDAQAPGSMPSQCLISPLHRVAGRGATWARADKLWWEIVALPAAAARRRVALVHYLYWAAPLVATARVVVTVHDVIPLALGDYHRGPASAAYARLMAATVRRADAVITVSEHARRDVRRLLRIPDHRIHVTYEAADARFNPRAEPGESERLRARYGLPERFVLYLGGAERRKNLETLVRAWRDVPMDPGEKPAELVIVADFPPPDALYPDIPGLTRRLGLEGRVRVVPRVDEADKPALYRSALLFCFPSAYEGFGLPPLEAMACGAPVLASSATSLPEVTGDAACLLPAGDVGAWARAIRALLESVEARARLRESGLVRAARFSWDRTAEQTAAVYREVLGR